MSYEWQDHDWAKSKHPERERNYITFLELASQDGSIYARIEQFTNNPTCFYATTPNDRSGCLGTIDWARQWCETKTNNKVN